MIFGLDLILKYKDCRNLAKEGMMNVK